MKDKINHLKHIETFGIDFDDFYNITVSHYGIKLQGKYNDRLVRDLSEFFVFSISDQGYIISQANIDGHVVSIVLT